MGLLPLSLDIWFQLPITVSSTTPKLITHALMTEGKTGPLTLDKE